MDGIEAAFWNLQERVSREPITVLHGDPHPRNTYTLPDGRMGVLDWQLIRRGSWSHDVGYALIGALPPSFAASMNGNSWTTTAADCSTPD